MRQAGRGENRQFLSADQSIQSVDGRDTGLNKFLRVSAGCRVHRQTVDVAPFIRNDLRAAVNRVAQSVEDAGEHILGDAELHALAEEADL